MPRLLLCSLFILLVAESRAQSEVKEPYSIGQINIGLGNTYMFQPAWEPYRNQTILEITYLWNTVDRKLLMDVGFSFAADFYWCDSCNPPIISQHFDAMIYTLHYGVGKWWRHDKLSAAITGGLLLGFSQYDKYTITPGSVFSQVEITFRGHAGIYIRSSADFKIKDRMRVGPFFEYRLSSASNEKNLTLNISSVAFGLYVGWRTEN